MEQIAYLYFFDLAVIFDFISNIAIDVTSKIGAKWIRENSGIAGIEIGSLHSPMFWRFMGWARTVQGSVSSPILYCTEKCMS